MITEAIDFRYLLLDNYKKLKISEEDLACLMMVDHLISQGNPFVSADLLSLKMSLDVNQIDQILSNLLTKGYISYVTENNKTVTSLEPLKVKLYREFQISLSKEESQKTSRISEELKNIYGEFQHLLGRSLSPLEISKIREWVSLGYTDESIINALKDCIAKGKNSLRSVDKALLTSNARDDIQNEGFTSISSDWDKNLQETIRIAKTPWIDDDDD